MNTLRDKLLEHLCYHGFTTVKISSNMPVILQWLW